MKFEEFKINTHKNVKEHFKNNTAPNFSDEFLRKCYDSKNEVLDILGGETIIIETSSTKSLDSLFEDLLKYLNPKCNDPDVLTAMRSKVTEMLDEFAMLKSRGFFDDSLRFIKDYQGIRTGQKLSKFIKSKYSDTEGELREIFEKSNSKINEIISAGNSKLFLRMSCSMKDYLRLGFQAQSSCTTIYSDYAPNSRYSKAAFTYAQTSTFIATLYDNSNDAINRADTALVRQVFYMKDDLMLGMRKYGHSQEYLNNMTKEVSKYFKEKGCFDDYKYLINLRNKKAVNYRDVKADLLKECYVDMSPENVGYVDTFHYVEAKGDTLFYNINYEELEFQESIFDTDYDFEDDPENRILLKNDMKEKLTNIYTSLMNDINPDNLLIPIRSDMYEDYSEFSLNRSFFEYINDPTNAIEDAVAISVDV